MKEYDKQLNFYYYEETYQDTQTYLEKYWLMEDELINFWEPIKRKIFINSDKFYPEVMFNDEFDIIPLVGGCLFGEESFNHLMNCIKFAGDKNFVVLQNYDESDPPAYFGKYEELLFCPELRFKFPVCIDWTELSSGGRISYELVEMPHNEYFVFSESGSWGKYTANDCEYPIEFIGFKKEYSTIFRTEFKLSMEENDRVFNEFLLPEHRGRIKRFDL